MGIAEFILYVLFTFAGGWSMGWWFANAGQQSRETELQWLRRDLSLAERELEKARNELKCEQDRKSDMAIAGLSEQEQLAADYYELADALDAGESAEIWYLDGVINGYYDDERGPLEHDNYEEEAMAKVRQTQEAMLNTAEILRTLADKLQEQSDT